MTTRTDYKALVEEALAAIEHARAGYYDGRFSGFYIEKLARALLALDEENQQLQAANATLLHERTLAYNDLTVANLEIRNLRERLAGGKLD